MTASLIPVISADHMQLASLTENEPFLPDEIILEIFSHFNLQELVICRTIASRFITKIDDLVLKKIKQCMTTFGKEEWETYFGEVDEAPQLPPLNVFKEIYKTYMLVFVPKTVKGKPLTLNLFKILAANPYGGGHLTIINTHSTIVDQFGDMANPSSRWVFFPKNILKGTKGQTYTEQTQIFAAKGEEYEMPRMLDAVVSLASRHVQSGERLFSDCYTLCQETINFGFDDLRLIVGRSDSGGLDVDFFYICARDGIAAVRKMPFLNR